MTPSAERDGPWFLNGRNAAHFVTLPHDIDEAAAKLGSLPFRDAPAA